MKDPKKAKRNSSKPYSGTQENYARYRPSIPKEVIDIIIKYFNIKPSDRILDLGCGTGQVAIAMSGKCGEMVCVDPEPEMLIQAKRAIKNSNIAITWINSNAEGLGKLRESLGTFKVATSCRAFHRMNQEQVLRNLDGLIEPDGGVAVFSDRVLWSGDEEWQLAIKKLLRQFLGEKKRGGPCKLWEDTLARSVFRYVNTHNVPVIRCWNVESIIGYVFSTAAAAPRLFGDQLDRFKEGTKKTLLSINPKDTFRETAVWSIVLGSKKPRG